MSKEPFRGSSARMAAGGLVWSNNAAGVRIAIVHRVKHDDWALPKGKPEPDELPQD
ncbi:MAG TPA: NUDIX hydrolase, partial [Verrucomicrobiales bacterium]|nr:NUDIX hydrolase [Verrucomicrobiales bacterium]